MKSPNGSVIGVRSDDHNKHLFPPTVARVTCSVLYANGPLFWDLQQSFICLQIGEGTFAVLACGEDNY